MTEPVDLFVDTETFCETPIAHGTHRYAEDAEVMILAWAQDDPLMGELPPTVEDLTDDDGVGHWGRRSEAFDAALQLTLDTGGKVVMHNSGFDRTVLRHQGTTIEPDRVHDTMVQAFCHGLPGGLGPLSTIFKLGEDSKHEGGKDLILLFCKPRPKNQKLRRATKNTHPEEWERFVAYAGGDITSMRALRRKLPNWNYPGQAGSNQLTEYDTWVLDQRVNDRGFAVDLDLAEAAIDLFARVKKRNDDYVEETTYGDVTSANQRQKLLEHLLSFYGVSLPDMTKSTLERRIEDPNIPEVVKELLRARLDTAVASVSKYKALMRSVSADGRLRGTIQFCGASRTGRDAGRIFQPQNLVRPDKAEARAVDEWIEAIKTGAGDLILPNAARASAVALRGAIVAGEGKKLVVADLSNIEGRVLAWLAGEKWKLEAFRDYDAGVGHDLYKIGAGRILGKKPDVVSDDERQVMGKVPELALGFQGAVGAFATMAALYGLDLEEQRVKEIVYSWREANPNIQQLWRDMEEAAREATLSTGKTTYAGKIAFNRWKEWLRMQLPSGRVLCYCQPAIVAHPKFEGSTSLSYLGVNSYTRKWERIHTYGGKLCLAEGTLVLTRQGWIAIEQVLPGDEVWDGDAWVSTDGRIDNGVTGVIKAFGSWMTPDHEILTDKGWKRASQSKGHNRAACRVPDGYRVPRVRWQEELVGCDVRVRVGSGPTGVRVEEAEGKRGCRVVRLQTQGDYLSAEDLPRHDETPGIRSVAVPDRSLPVAFSSGMAQLRRAWDLGLRALGDQLRKLLGRHGAFLQGRVDARTGGQRAGLLESELSMGQPQDAGQQHAEERTPRRRGDRSPVRGSGRDASLDSVLPVSSRVFDLMNCGPRNRFVIATEEGPLIVHNCENAVQATARDVLKTNSHGIEEEGYPIILPVHDETVTEVPDEDSFTTERLCRRLAALPWWADEALPLAAAGFQTKRYKKE